LDTKRGILLVEVSRGGSVDETLQFLIDLRNAYENLYALDLKIDDARKKVEPSTQLPSDIRRGRPPALSPNRRVRDVVLPNERLAIGKIEVGSPGFWEFLGALSPIVQLREFAKDRHERRKDKEWREAQERREMVLENEKRERDVQKLDLQNIQLRDSILSDQIKVLLSLGYTEEQIRRLLNAHYFGPLSHLEHHFDSGLITSVDAEEKNSQ
jgi:hypothetical protein